MEGGTYKDVNPNNETAAVAPEGGNLAVFIVFWDGILETVISWKMLNTGAKR